MLYSVLSFTISFSLLHVSLFSHSSFHSFSGFPLTMTFTRFNLFTLIGLSTAFVWQYLDSISQDNTNTNGKVMADSRQPQFIPWPESQGNILNTSRKQTPSEKYLLTLFIITTTSTRFCTSSHVNKESQTYPYLYGKCNLLINHCSEH